MKKTEDIVDYNLREILDIAVMNSSYCRNILIRVIKQAQVDAIKSSDLNMQLYNLHCLMWLSFHIGCLKIA